MKICVFENSSSLAKSFCEELEKLVKNSNENFSIALSGGSTPEIIYKELGENYSDKIDWTKINFYWGDERCVPPTSDESNFKLVKENLFDKINIPDENIFRIKGEANPETETERYENLLINYLRIKNNLPQFDLTMLGLGDDGHTASIFPNQMDLMKSNKLAAVAVHPKTGQQRITLTGKVLNNSKRVYFFITSKKKSGIVSEILRNKEKEKYPAGRIDPVGRLYWYLDKAAASRLK